jgi:hypothetical protein
MHCLKAGMATIFAMVIGARYETNVYIGREVNKGNGGGSEFCKINEKIVCEGDYLPR